MKRLLIFFFYDNNGDVDPYVDVMLKDMAACVDKVLVVCNGKLTSNGRHLFRKYSDTVIVRENIGLDVWAYKTGIDYLGWGEICGYDEMIMMNHTICGPIYPFEEMFTEMDSRTVDFWGITVYYGCGSARPKNWPDNGYDTVQDHLQSHFIAVRKHMLLSPEFQKYWNDIPPINSYYDSVSLHESCFTRRFSDMGFTWDCYVDCSDISDFNNYPLMFNSPTLIRKKRCPIIKRKRNVYLPYKGLIQFYSLNYELRDMFEAVKECSDYDMDMIIENTLRTSLLHHFQRGTLTDFISSEKGNSVYEPADRKKTAIVLNVNNEKILGYNEKMLSYFKEYINDTFTGFDVYVIADEKFNTREYFSSEISVICKYEKTSTVQLFTVLEELSDSYEYLYALSFYIRKKNPYVSVDFNCLRMGFDSLIYSKGQTGFITDTFECNKHLGLLVQPSATDYINFEETQKFRAVNYKCAKQYAESIGVLHSEDNFYHYPANCIFALRSDMIKGFTESLEKCFGTSEDLPYELLLPLYAQSRRYYTGRVMTDYAAKLLFSVSENMLYNKGEIK